MHEETGKLGLQWAHIGFEEMLQKVVSPGQAIGGKCHLWVPPWGTERQEPGSPCQGSEGKGQVQGPQPDRKAHDPERDVQQPPRWGFLSPPSCPHQEADEPTLGTRHSLEVTS